MSASNEMKFEDVFNSLATAQVLSIAASVKQVVTGSRIRTNIATAHQAHIGENAGAQALFLAVKVEAHGFNDEPEVFSSECQVFGVWPVRDQSSLTEAELLKLGSSIEAIQTLYLIARQHLNDVLAKVGLQATEWPWHVGNTTHTTAEGAPARKRSSRIPKSKKSSHKK